MKEFVWKSPTISDSKENFLKFRTINDEMGFSISHWYLKSINEIDIIKMDPKTYNQQVQFYVIEEQTIFFGETLSYLS